MQMSKTSARSWKMVFYWCIYYVFSLFQYRKLALVLRNFIFLEANCCARDFQLSAGLFDVHLRMEDAESADSTDQEFRCSVL